MPPRLRVYSERLDDSQTLPIFLSKRTGHEGRDGWVLRLACALSLLVFMLLYVASGLLAGGKLFSSLFDVPLTYAIILGTLINRPSTR